MVMALFFATISFSGIWASYLTFLKVFPRLYREFATATLFIPSVIFWGSGIAKDSLAMGALGWLFYGFYTIAIEKRRIILNGLIIFIASYFIFTLKVYILLSFLPPALLWIFNENTRRIPNKTLRRIAKPIFLCIGAGAAYIAATTLTAGDRRYDVEKIAETSSINSQYLSEQVKTGSAYNIGTFDGTLNSVHNYRSSGNRGCHFQAFPLGSSKPFYVTFSFRSPFLFSFNS
jgi:hypothetical protein